MILAALIWLALAWPAIGQELPDWQYVRVNDLAEILTGGDIVTLDRALIDLSDSTGIQGTVVTLKNRAQYGGSDGLEPFATRLFNHWGIGDARRDDGFMMLVLIEDREARIELGAGYPAAANAIARDIMDKTMLPDFRAGQMSQGVRDGTLAIIDRIARPAHSGSQLMPPGSDIGTDTGKSPIWQWPLLAMFLVPFSLFVLWQAASLAGLIGGGIREILLRFRSCPECNHRGLVRMSGGADFKNFRGQEVRGICYWRACPECGWASQKSRPKRVRMFSPHSTSSYEEHSHSRHHHGSGGFGGGSSSGGGASGRW